MEDHKRVLKEVEESLLLNNDLQGICIFMILFCK